MFYKDVYLEGFSFFDNIKNKYYEARDRRENRDNYTLYIDDPNEFEELCKDIIGATREIINHLKKNNLMVDNSVKNNFSRSVFADPPYIRNSKKKLLDGKEIKLPDNFKFNVAGDKKLMNRIKSNGADSSEVAEVLLSWARANGFRIGSGGGDDYIAVESNQYPHVIITFSPNRAAYSSGSYVTVNIGSEYTFVRMN